MPRVSPPPRNSVNDRPARLQTAVARGRSDCCARPPGSSFALLLALLLIGLLRSAAPGGSLATLRERIGDATAFAGLRVQRHRHRGPRQHAGAAAARRARRQPGAIRSWASRWNRRAQRIETLSWVEQATVERRLPDTIVVNMEERRPFAIWQNDGKFVLIDRDGQVVAHQDVANFRNCRWWSGLGAPDAAAAADRCADRAARPCRRAWSPRCASASGAGTCS